MEVAVIKEFHYFPKLKKDLYGAAMLDNMACNFAKIMTRKPKIGN